MQNNMQNNQDLPRKEIYFIFLVSTIQAKKELFIYSRCTEVPCTHGWDEKRVINLKLDRMIKVYLFQ